MKRKIVVLAGMAGSGKSTIGSKIQSYKNIRFFPEIGRECRQLVACTTLDFCPLFDEVVMYKELDRDSKILSLSKKIVPVVETWHIGNLSYAELRNPKIYKHYFQVFRGQLRKFEVLVLLLTIDSVTFEKRRTDIFNKGQDQKHKQFYISVYKSIKRVIKNQNILHIDLDGTQPVNKLVQQIINYVYSFYKCNIV